MAIIDRGEAGGARGQPPEEKRPTPTLRDLARHPKARLWAIRAGVVLVVGLLFAIVFNPRVGLTIAVAVLIADTVRTARAGGGSEGSYPVSPAERKTERQLRGLEKAGWRALHARAVPRDGDGVSDGKIDHLVIGPTGVYAIDSESWDRRLPVRALSHTRLFHGPFEMKDRLDEARWEANQASRLLSKAMGTEIPVQPSVAIYGPPIPWRWMSVRNVDVYSGAKAKTYLRKRPRVLTPEDVERIAAAAERVFPSKFDLVRPSSTEFDRGRRASRHPAGAAGVPGDWSRLAGTESHAAPYPGPPTF
ncbi:NERD domain-containing protein [Actinocorallia sp. API 0066]|uniref:nuclease-related domain-containing protein n=1 Tax=Actinocorallia sp. API 0066 TaxID=2896846 RepID=UPI001E52E49A|nr:nuclease-related domain-containing protein [Actinocorallia sp. API 0066]MCD0452804.1 NERD domain-containing protein [Actinocorallia sp. API 0066]